MAFSEPLTSPRAARARLTKRLFPNGVPRLWCPTLTHFAARGEFDELRIRRHLQIIAPHVKGILLPGSTGEGWEMNDADLQRLPEVALDAALAADLRVLIGVLKTDLPGTLQCLHATVDFLKRRAGVPNVAEALQRTNVVGFTGSGRGPATGANSGSFFISLKPISQRDPMPVVINRLRKTA